MKFTKDERLAISIAVNNVIDGYIKLFGEKEAKERLIDFYTVREKIRVKARKRMLKAVVESEVDAERAKQQAQQLGGAA